MLGMYLRKSTKDESNKGFIRMAKDKKTKSCIENIFGDISKSSASKQVVLGVSSGCITGFLAVRIGKVIAITLGGGIIILQIANQQGYINVNWDKVNRKVDKVVDKVEEKLTGEGPSWADKMERFVERKLDKTEDVLKHKHADAKRWYSSFTGGPNGCQIKEIHIFLLSFFTGVAIGMAAS